MEFKTNTGAIAITIIILIIALPKTGYLMDYRLDYCNDYDQIDEGGIFRAIATESVGIDQNGFYVCEIGFINANVEILIEVQAVENSFDCIKEEIAEYYSVCNLEFFILNKDNYQNFVQGESYIETNNLFEFWGGAGNEQLYADSSNLLYDTYYFVMNWEYRTTNTKEFSGPHGYSRDFAGAYTTNWDDESDFRFKYALDIDYTEDNLKGNL